MANCITCNKPLGMMNTPVFGKGKTSDGGIICTSCHMTMALKASSIVNKIKTITSAEIVAAYNEILTKKQEREGAGYSRTEELRKIIGKLNPAASFKSEVAELASILLEEETIEKVDTGYLKEGKGAKGNGLIVATNLRLIFIDKSTFGLGVKMEDFPYDKITSVSVETGFLKGELKIMCSGNNATIDLVNGAKSLSEFVRKKTLSKPLTIPQQVIIQQIGISENEVFPQLEKLGILKEKGILTEEEFLTQKARLLTKL